MDDPADLSSQNGSGRYLLDEGSSTRNRKVVGSNPTSGSKLQVRALRCSPCLSPVNDCVDPRTQTDRLDPMHFIPRRHGDADQAEQSPAAALGQELLPDQAPCPREPPAVEG